MDKDSKVFIGVVIFIAILYVGVFVRLSMDEQTDVGKCGLCCRQIGEKFKMYNEEVGCVCYSLNGNKWCDVEEVLGAIGK